MFDCLGEDGEVDAFFGFDLFSLIAHGCSVDGNRLVGRSYKYSEVGVSDLVHKVVLRDVVGVNIASPKD